MVVRVHSRIFELFFALHCARTFFCKMRSTPAGPADLVARRGRGGGRGVGGVRGAGGDDVDNLGRHQPAAGGLAAHMDDSGASDNEIIEEMSDRLLMIEAAPFPTHVASSDDDDEAGGVGAPDAAPAVYESVQDFIGKASCSFNYPFEPGGVIHPPERTLERFRDLSPTDIVLYLAQPFFNVLKECSNVDPTAQLTMKDLYCYHAVLTLMAYLPLPDAASYWRDLAGFTWSEEVLAMRTIFNRTRYRHVRSKLKAFLPEDDIPNKSRGWKVARAVAAVQDSFRSCKDRPNEFLSADEGVAQGISTRNPIYCSLGKAQHLEGYRFFVLSEIDTKIAINFMLDDKQLSPENCRDRPGGFSGSVIDTLCSTAPLPGKWYKIMADNYYCTVEFCEYLRDNRRILVGGTMTKNHTVNLVYFGNAKKAKPSRAHPKGKLLVAKKLNNATYVYGWMDSSPVFFVDVMWGPGEVTSITRESAQGQLVLYQVPKLIDYYNKYKHVWNMFHQMRQNFGVDPTLALKYTVRIFEILFSMILTQSYNIYQALHKSNQTRSLGHFEFKYSVVKGLLTHPVVGAATAVQILNDHSLAQTEPGSDGPDRGNRRRVGECRQCPTTVDGARNTSRRTNWYCTQCKKFFHPQCFYLWHGHSGAAPRSRASSSTARNVRQRTTGNT